MFFDNETKEIGKEFYPVVFETIIKESTINNKIYLADVKVIEEKESLIFLSAVGESPWIIPNAINKEDIKKQRLSNVLPQAVFLQPCAYVEIAKMTKSFSLFLKRKDNNEFEKVEIDKKTLEFFARRMIEQEYGKRFLSQPTANSGEHETIEHTEDGDVTRRDYIPWKDNPIPGRYYLKSMEAVNLFNQWILPTLWDRGIYVKPEDRKDLTGTKVNVRHFEFLFPSGMENIFNGAHRDGRSPHATFGKGWEEPLAHLHRNNNGVGVIRTYKTYL